LQVRSPRLVQAEKSDFVGRWLLQYVPKLVQPPTLFE
ncbi:hypothetical protein VN97_g13136, partial [Penicillium thymicola]